MPCWKTSTSRPYAAPTESRLRTTAVPAMTTERKTTVSRMKVRPSTSRKTYGAGSETESR